MAIFLVTGGAGFIGSHVVDRLVSSGHTVRVLDDLSTGKRGNLDRRADLIEGDITDAALVRRVAEGVSGIFHLAAIASVESSKRDWIRTHAVNQSGSVAVLDAARSAGRVPVVYASSAAIYGYQGEAAIDESSRPNPCSAYGVDKLGSELHAAVATSIHGVPTCGLRFFNVYGPRQDPTSPYSGVISIFASRIAAEKQLTIFGDGEQVRDFIYVHDVVAHALAAFDMLRAADEPLWKSLNVCTGAATSINRLVSMMGEILGKTAEVARCPARSGDIRISIGNPQLARASLGEIAITPLLQGLRATIAAS